MLTAPPLVLAVGGCLLDWWLTPSGSILMFFLRSTLFGGALATRDKARAELARLFPADG